ncbi:hypothetical protein GP486_003330 [Trichoglossum hirsutum]|uniref:Uncharacterized protein n=1 Tax=Trichoglossum hirsutum TaxID=265104 RepID=A0A9P8LD99_9PEZI|nr:hypothetical protein GP486_003330 [Trichoglossum hirsutum]
MLPRILLPVQRALSRHDALSIRPINSILQHPNLARFYVSRSEADIKIDSIQEQYMIAKDEVQTSILSPTFALPSLTHVYKFEIAAEETSKNSACAREDRETARGELVRLKELYAAVTGNPESSVAAEIERRVGQRVRELENAVEELNKADLED